VTLQTPIPGVSVALTGTSASVAGSDMETDASMITRCRLKWSTVAGLNGVGGATKAAYQYYALSATGNIPITQGGAPQVGYAYVLTGNPDGPGTVRVYVSAVAGAMGGAVFASDAATSVVNVNTAIQAILPQYAACVVHAATAVTITLTGNVFYYSSVFGSGSAAQLQVRANLAAYFASLGISDGSTTTLYWSRALEAIELPNSGVQGIRNVSAFQMNAGTSDIVPAQFNVVQFNDLLTYTGV
jgi:hypothetical protein